MIGFKLCLIRSWNLQTETKEYLGEYNLWTYFFVSLIDKDDDCFVNFMYKICDHQKEWVCEDNVYQTFCQSPSSFLIEFLIAQNNGSYISVFSLDPHLSYNNLIISRFAHNPRMILHPIIGRTPSK